MRVLVTGATGFIGRHLVKALVQRGHSVVAVARNLRAFVSSDFGDAVKCIPFDIDSPLVDPRAVFGDVDCVAHLAWPGLPNYREPFHFEANLPAAYRFLKLLVEAGYQRIFVSGTCFEYGMREGIYKECSSRNPHTAYGLAKDSLFRFLLQLQHSMEFNLVWGRLFYLYGEGQSPKSLLSQLQKAIENNEPSFPMSGGEQLRDYLPIETAAAIIAELLELKQNVGAVNICSGKPTSVRTLVEQWLTTHEKKIALDLGQFPYAEYEPMAFWGSREKLDRLLGNSNPVAKN